MGDLAFHIKKRRAKSEFFTETEIMNWFVQLCLALEYIHGRKVMHRDIKSQNVFLTRNNTIKLGDFGISKVLENTNDVPIFIIHYVTNYLGVVVVLRGKILLIERLRNEVLKLVMINHHVLVLDLI